MGRLQDELDALAAGLGRSLTLDGPDGALLAHSLQADDADAARTTAILRRRVAPEVRAWESRHLDSGARDPVPVPANRALGMAARLGLPIRDPRTGRALGSLWMPATQRRLPAASVAAARPAAGRHPDRGAAGAGPPAAPVGPDVDRLVRGLAADRAAAEDAVAGLRTAVPALVEGVARVVAAVPAGPGRAGVVALDGAAFAALAHALTPTLRAHPGYVGAAVEPDHTLVLVHGTSPPDRLLDALDALVGRHTPATLGVSEPAPFGSRTVRAAVRQALAAAELAALDPALPRRCGWPDLGGYRRLLDGRADDSALAGLAAAGPASAAMLAHTLETYLDLGGDVRATAARLSLHRSSLYYRLDRIAALLRVELSDGLARLDLHLALKARRAARRRLR